ncbi:hypothetical protein [Clostridium akagii]|uniref:hypothetical protein n=1 Tax=Clostridium akagii TaxID=91623 RepID=UPI00047CC706|nr:hypothetical protein [Clostridium akagii]
MDLKKLLIAFIENKVISIIELGTNAKCIFEGHSNKFDCEQGQYEVIKFDKIYFDNSYSIVVIRNT